MELPQTLRHDSIEHATEVLSQAFLKETFQNYLARHQLGLDEFADLTIEQNTALFSSILRDFQHERALFVTAPDAPTVASVWVMETPSRSRDEEGGDSIPKAVVELTALAGPIWQREFPNGRKVLHLVLVGNVASASREKGQKGASFVIREMIETASRAGIPVILEATSFKARDIYKCSGFEVVEEVYMGKGSVNAEGRSEPGGVGFPLTLMKYCG